MLAISCAGCVSTQALREDAERVFREHNRVASAVMFELTERDPDAPATRALVAADRAMLAACEPLNTLAAARRDGKRITLRQRLRIPRAIEACRTRTGAAVELLQADFD